MRKSIIGLLLGALICCQVLVCQSEVVKTPPAPKKKSFADQVDRWFDAQQLQLSTRYRVIETSTDVISTNQWQYKQSYKFRFKFDPKGNYTINAGLFTGTNFTGSWNNTSVGTGDFVGKLYFKQLFFEAKPIKGLELQFGGLYINRGEGSEVISYDTDGYIMGERLSLKRPKQLFFDEISVTYAYLGDVSTPNIFGKVEHHDTRFGRLEQSNYHQFLVDKKIGKRAGISADYTFQSGIETLRQAIKVNTKELRFTDSILFENYERLDVLSAYGMNLMFEKPLHKRVTISPGFAYVDKNYSPYSPAKKSPYWTITPLNGDFYARGTRFYLLATVVLTPEFSVVSQFTQAFHNDYAIANRTRFDLALNYNFLKSLQRWGVLKSPPKKK